jgi:acetyltransferase
MSLEAFFHPESVAVVGASRTEGKVGNAVLTCLVRGGFPGAVYPVNPRADTIEGRRCYPDLKSLPAAPDLVVVAVPAGAVVGVLKDCVAAGVKSVIVVTAGFRESGEAGARIEGEVAEIVRRSGIRMLGPNCLGMMVPGHNLNASFSGDMPAPGSIGYMSQSGSMLAAIVDMANAGGIGFSKLVSVGNKTDIDELDILKAMGRDADTQVIAGYLETVTNADGFMREAERVSHEKPILLMKSGTTRAGARAASAHTGGRASTEAAAYECLFERAGIVRCNSIKAQFDYALAFAEQPLPAGPRVAVVANGGGPCIMAADAVERQGLEPAVLGEETRKRLAAVLPPEAPVANPMDILGDARAARYRDVLRVALDSPDVDMVLVLMTPHAVTECDATAAAIVELAAEQKKPVLASFLGGNKVAEGIRILRRGRVPHYDSPENAVETLRVMFDYARWRSRPKRVVRLFPVNRRKVERIVERSQRRSVTELDEVAAMDVLDAYGFAIPQGAVATSADQAANLAEQFGFPVLLKIASPDIVDKAAVGGIRTNLAGREEVRDAFDLMMYRIPKQAPDADITGVLVQEGRRSGQEFMLGMRRDAHFGPLMMFGKGGLMVEVLKDVAFYLAPLTAEEAAAMLRRTRTWQMLDDGGAEGVDIDLLAEGLQRLSQLATEFAAVQEVEINPYVVGPGIPRPVAAGARIRVGS